MIVIVFFLPNGIVPALSTWWKGRSGGGGGGVEPMGADRAPEPAEERA
jgi:hypothetical protein